eukprot:GHRQ01022858.1.p1 GENE.GHRQ01022858.1~~GHRQ01022858.1.p1  ORF type:complete len:197 (+),score=28.94 GHRQ01022858.1:665-1255(+)
MLARMVTRGWQVWAPSMALLFHQWERSERPSSYQACGQVRGGGWTHAELCSLLANRDVQVRHPACVLYCVTLCILTSIQPSNIGLRCTLLCCPQVDKGVRAVSQARVLQLLCSGGLSAKAATPEEWNPSHEKQAGQMMHASQPPTAADWAPGGIWGLGTVKTLQEFGKVCGVDFTEKRIEQRALYGGQDPSMFVDT